MISEIPPSPPPQHIWKLAIDWYYRNKMIAFPCFNVVFCQLKTSLAGGVQALPTWDIQYLNHKQIACIVIKDIINSEIINYIS